MGAAEGPTSGRANSAEPALDWFTSMRLLLVGDTQGIGQLLRHMSGEDVVALCGASIRPQYVEPLRVLAEELGVPFIVQPRRADSEFEAFVENIRELALDLIVVNSYSMLIPPEVLRLSRKGGVNIHASLLPRNRGPNPIQWAMIRGEHSTGVTMHEMTAGFDEGSIIAQREVPISFEDTWQTVRARLDRATEDLLRDNRERVTSGRWTSTPQEESSATRNKRRGPGDSYFDWNDRLIDIYRLHRAVLPPLPPAWSIDRTGARVELTTPLTPMALMNLLWAERRIPVPPGGAMAVPERTDCQRVKLRPIRTEDSALLYEWILDRELAILNTPYWHVSDVDHDAWIESTLVPRSDLVIFVIEEENGKPIGTCQLVNINLVHRSAELQIQMAPGAQGRGLGTLAITKLCDFGFRDLGLHRISLHVWATNCRAIRAHEKAGFRREGLLREAAFVDGRFGDVIVMGLVNTQK